MHDVRRQGDRRHARREPEQRARRRRAGSDTGSAAGRRGAAAPPPRRGASGAEALRVRRSCPPRGSRVVPHVRDLRNRVRPRHRRPRPARGDELDARPSRARLGRGVRRRAGRPRGPAARDHRPRDRRPADHERGRHGVDGRPERRDLQLPRAPPRARSAPAIASRRAATPRCSSTSTRSTATRFVERLRGMFAIALWDSERAAARARARPLRDQAALLPRRRRRARRSPPSCARCRAARSTSTRSTRSSPSTRFRGR